MPKLALSQLENHSPKVAEELRLRMLLPSMLRPSGGAFKGEL
jgi:hypothetical protein